jgi:predicted unusual protein kinase regulating ubiquinone biosynthesis (AarF/ABC1/UbiB family)
MAKDPSPSRFRRALKLGRLAARVGGRLALKSTAERELQVAEDLLQTLGGMRGAPQKLGQLLSYVHQDLPASTRRVLSGLQAQAPAMPDHQLQSVLVQELGAPPSQVFERFSPEPLAVASIGQVHRARTRDGREVVVKVQVPGVEASIRADLANAGPLLRLGALAFPQADPRELREELLAVMLGECDYRLEARHQTRFRAIWQDHPSIAVPEVLPELSTGRVLTSAYSDRDRFAAFQERAGEEERTRAGHAMLEFMLASLIRHGLFNGDPHPGNYLFGPEGQVTFLDFGCVKQIDEADRAGFRDFLAAVLDEDEEALMRALRTLGYVPPGVEMSASEWMRVERVVQRPWVEDELFRFEPAFAREIAACVLKNPDLRQAGVPGDFLLFNRLQWGLYAVLTELRVEGRFYGIVRGLLDEA